MAVWNKFCCAIDFSDPSRLAMQQAAELTRRFEGRLELLHVQPLPPPAVAMEAIPPSPGALEMLARELKNTMAAWQEEAARITGTPVGSTIVPGNPVNDIVRFARERAMDVVVLGSHGKGALTRLLLGSVAERVVREAPCPVVVIRRRETAGATDTR